MLERSGAFIGGALTMGLAGCASIGLDSESEPVDGVLVRMTSDFIYDPESVTVPVGEMVVWRTQGFTPHTVTVYEDEIPEAAEYFASGDYESEQAARDGFTDGGGEVGRNETYEHTLEVPGTYEYFCIPHESSMIGTVIVEDPG